MQSFFTYSITPDISGTLYDLSAHLALLAFLLILFYEGHRRQFPMAAWMTALAIIITAGFFGSRIGVFDMAAWHIWWQEGIFPEATERTSIGVVVFLFPAIWLIKRGLRFEAPFLDTLAFALPVLAIIRRLGCLAAACCYGLPTEGGWGLRFMGPSVIRDQHWAAGITGADRFGTAAVHPVQLYFIVGALLSILLLQKYRKHFQRAGNLTLFSLALLLGFRFFIEFFRDPLSNHQLGYTLLGLKQVQWFLLAATLILALSIYLRERNRNMIQATSGLFNKVGLCDGFPFRARAREGNRHTLLNSLATPAMPSLTRIFFVNVLLTTFVFWMKDNFLLSEKIGIHTILILSGLALVHDVLQQQKTQPQMKWQAAMTALLAIFLMGQSYPDQMSKIEDGKIRSFHANWNRLNLNEPTYNCLEIASGCGGDYCALADSLQPNGALYHSFNLGYNAMNFKTIRKKRVRPGRDSTYQTHFEYGLDFQPEFFYDEPNDYRKFRGNLMPYIGAGNDFIGFRGGLRMGSIWSDGGSDIPESKPAALMASLRLGNPDVFYFRFDVSNSTVIGASASTLESSITFNFNDYSRNHWKYLRIGIGNTHTKALRMYLEPAFNLGEHFIFTPRFGYTFRPEKTDERKEAFYHPSFGLGLHYRLK